MGSRLGEVTSIQMTQIIAVLNQKGGVGKTTTAINVAAYLGQAGHTVLVVDLDPQGNATSGFGIDKLTLRCTTLDILSDPSSAAGSIVSTHAKNVDVIPTNADLAGAEIGLAAYEHREHRLYDALQQIGSEYEYVLIDCPPSLGLLTVNALTAAQSVLIPVQTEYYAMEGLGQLIQLVQLIQTNLNPSLQILGVLLTMYDSRTSLSEQVKAEVIRVFGDLVFQTNIPRNVRLAEAPSHGKPVVYYDKWSKGARAYKHVAREVVERGSR